MAKEINTVLEAAREWVNSFNSFPLAMIEKLFYTDVEDWHEITPVIEGKRVWCNEYQEMGEIIDITKNEDEEEIAKVKFDNGKEIKISTYDLSIEEDSFFPMWGTMWQFSSGCDDLWLECNLEEMARCGLRIYESEEFGYFFGIDGAGYDFYEQHWIPLYNKRGLKWHE